MARSAAIPNTRNGIRSPNSSATNPPASGPSSVPARFTPAMPVIMRPRRACALESAMTVSLVICHICCARPLMPK